MNARFSKHALDELVRRGISRDIVEEVLRNPDQIVSGGGRKRTYQSKVDFGGRIFLVRVIVAHDVDPPLVVTLYRTSKIDKYWETP